MYFRDNSLLALLCLTQAVRAGIICTKSDLLLSPVVSHLSMGNMEAQPIDYNTLDSAPSSPGDYMSANGLSSGSGAIEAMAALDIGLPAPTIQKTVILNDKADLRLSRSTNLPTHSPLLDPSVPEVKPTSVASDTRASGFSPKVQAKVSGSIPNGARHDEFPPVQSSLSSPSSYIHSYFAPKSATKMFGYIFLPNGSMKLIVFISQPANLFSRQN